MAARDQGAGPALGGGVRHFGGCAATTERGSTPRRQATDNLLDAAGPSLGLLGVEHQLDVFALQLTASATDAGTTT